ncbi:endonuclease domain-containing protein [Rhizobium sp. GN54]|uniref:endonuclease domain-containing protein n=1 Tax=Rhizobium sp. GN54 TaxID=2898150 RepID=UPI001E3551D2|nr:endonuclease domain-containing protein [Rhizobium sp. GN54]MCD2184287.1 endonuclease domain-containing protein [Rhizobium sp. GN54]
MRGANSSKTERARKLRQVENDAEGLLWSELRGRRLNGFKFVRQVPIGPYFADFACRERMLVVEVDGSHHADNAYDERRNEFMNTNGWSVARFWNTEVLRELKSVLETIVAICDGRLVERTHATDFTFLPVTERS